MEEKWEKCASIDVETGIDAFIVVMKVWAVAPEHVLEGVRYYDVVWRKTYDANKKETSCTFFKTKDKVPFPEDLKENEQYFDEDTAKQTNSPCSYMEYKRDLWKKGSSVEDKYEDTLWLDLVKGRVEFQQKFKGKPTLDQVAFFYPKVEKFACYYAVDDKGQARVQVDAVWLPEIDFREKMTQISTSFLKTVKRWMKNEENGGYKKRSKYDQVVPRTMYMRRYDEMKKKYKWWADNWPERTAAQKYVYEDISLAAYLVSMWDLERMRTRSTKMQTFVDLGCGNGFLVYLLVHEGYDGKGVDLQKRKIWDKYPDNVKLELTSVYPDKARFPEADWILGNHSDELTPWIPYVAAMSSHTTRFWVLPCCFFDFMGKFEPVDPKIGKYKTYLNYVADVARKCGFKYWTDKHRIPSTKDHCIVGYDRNYDINNPEHVDYVESVKRSMVGSVGHGFAPKAKVDPNKGKNKFLRSLIHLPKGHPKLKHEFARSTLASYKADESLIPKKVKPLIPQISDEAVMEGTNLFGGDDSDDEY